MTISDEEHVARAIYEALGFDYSGRTVSSRNGPYGNWAVALKAARAAIAAMREREGAAAHPLLQEYPLECGLHELAFPEPAEAMRDKTIDECAAVNHDNQIARSAAEVMRAKCEAIVRAYAYDLAASPEEEALILTADAISALKGKP